jgi:hypothetical protein
LTPPEYVPTTVSSSGPYTIAPATTKITVQAINPVHWTRLISRQSRTTPISRKSAAAGR